MSMGEAESEVLAFLQRHVQPSQVWWLWGDCFMSVVYATNSPPRAAAARAA